MASGLRTLIFLMGRSGAAAWMAASACSSHTRRYHPRCRAGRQTGSKSCSALPSLENLGICLWFPLRAVPFRNYYPRTAVSSIPLGGLTAGKSCSEVAAIPIRILDLNSHQLSTVPGSKGLFSPRWSPDGHYLAALSGDSQKLMLYDFKTQKWAVWADEGHTVGFPNWSRDSRYVYFDWFFGKDQSYRRVKVGGNKSEELLSSKGLRRYFNWLGPWSGIAPDGTPLFVRDTSTQEIYALELQQP